MDDLTNMISQVLSDPEKVKQIQAMASSLGFSGAEAGAPAATPAVPAPAQPQAAPDLSALSGLLGNLGGAGKPAPDLSSLSGLLGGLTGNAQASPSPAQTGSGFDAASLAGLLRAGNPQQESGQSGFDIGTLARLQSAMANIQNNRGNIDLLLALKPRLSAAKAKKVDDAIRVMQIIQFLPLLKETGLFGQMDSILSGLGSGFGSILGGLGGGNSGGGLGGVLSGLGGGLGGLLGNLTGRR